jgi:hypothetical protein
LLLPTSESVCSFHFAGCIAGWALWHVWLFMTMTHAGVEVPCFQSTIGLMLHIQASVKVNCWQVTHFTAQVTQFVEVFEDVI